MSEQKPENYIVTINAYDFITTLCEESNKLAMRGIVLSGKGLFQFAGKIFVNKVKEQRVRDENAHCKAIKYED